MDNIDKVMFWGKYNEEAGSFLSLSAHSLDVAMVFRSLCDLRGIQRMLENCTSQDLTDAHLDRLAVLAMFHDAGKANLGFQRKVFDEKAPRGGHIRELSPVLTDGKLAEMFFDALPRGIGTWFADPMSANSYFFAVFSHHGRPFVIDESKIGNYWLAKNEWWYPEENRNPMEAIAEISAFAEWAFPKAFSSTEAMLPIEPGFHHRFAGLVMLADWIGSHQYWFPIVPTCIEERFKKNNAIIPVLLRSIGLDIEPLRPILRKTGNRFQDRFDFSPLPLQQVIDELNPNDARNKLIIAESETGSGKTEAALNWFCKLFEAGEVDSMYFALPTRVAARDLYERVNAYVQNWFPDAELRPVTLLAVPGYAQVDGYQVKQLIPDSSVANLWQEDQETMFRERRWAAEMPKRFLAATIAVGTIDQALLSTIQTSHAHLRSVCLDRSLLVVDEVHASDLYMSRLLESLLKHHLGIGGSAILLSATLGSTAANSFVGAVRATGASPDLQEAITTPYPLVTLSNGEKLPTSSVGKLKRVKFDISPFAFSPVTIVEAEIVPALWAGARVLVVMNTVDRAVSLFKALESHQSICREWLFNCRGEFCPHHGRFSPEDRLVLDGTMRERMGKGSPQGPVVVVGTQTLEQSLDIDADLLVTDLAPADVLLQRVGRLHRHERVRPKGYEMPRCLVLAPQKGFETALSEKGDVSGEYKKVGFGSVYEDLGSLELTLKFLKENPELTIPKDNRLFVEMATHPEALTSLVGTKWARHRNDLEGHKLAKKIIAGEMTCDYDQYFGDFQFYDLDRSVFTRLGANTLRFSLSEKVISPFGQQLSDIFVPQHLAPESLNESEMIVEEKGGGVIVMRCAERRYRYSRYGLEVIQ